MTFGTRVPVLPTYTSKVFCFKVFLVLFPVLSTSTKNRRKHELKKKAMTKSGKKQKVKIPLPTPRVEAGKNTSTVIPASRKSVIGRRKGNRISLR
jgi:hypothetical protein